MKNRMQFEHSFASWSIRQVAAAATVAAVVAATAGVAAARTGDESAPGERASYRAVGTAFKHPRLEHGVLKIKGTHEADRIALRLQAGAPGVLQVDFGDDGSADFSIDRSHVAGIAVDARAGDDLVRMDESNGVFTDTIPTTVDGGPGDDTLAGGRGNETLRGGPGNDSIDGNAGADVGVMGAGDDLFVWDPGDGSDVVEGEDGHDTMLFNGAAGAEQFELSANGHRLRFFRTQGAITMDTDGVERVDVTALGGTDLVTVNDLTGTAVSSVNVDLAGTLGGAAGDGQADRVVVNGTNGDDAIDVSGDAGGVKTSGLAATVGILHAEAANDRLEVNTLEGTDAVETAGLAAGAIQLLVDGALVP